MSSTTEAIPATLPGSAWPGDAARSPRSRSSPDHRSTRSPSAASMAQSPTQPGDTCCPTTATSYSRYTRHSQASETLEHAHDGDLWHATDSGLQFLLDHIEGNPHVNPEAREKLGPFAWAECGPFSFNYDIQLTAATIKALAEWTSSLPGPTPVQLAVDDRMTVVAHPGGKNAFDTDGSPGSAEYILLALLEATGIARPVPRRPRSPERPGALVSSTRRKQRDQGEVPAQPHCTVCAGARRLRHPGGPGLYRRWRHRRRTVTTPRRRHRRRRDQRPREHGNPDLAGLGRPACHLCPRYAPAARHSATPSCHLLSRDPPPRPRQRGLPRFSPGCRGSPRARLRTSGATASTAGRRPLARSAPRTPDRPATGLRTGSAPAPSRSSARTRTCRQRQLASERTPWLFTTTTTYASM